MDSNKCGPQAIFTKQPPLLPFYYFGIIYCTRLGWTHIEFMIVNLN